MTDRTAFYAGSFDPLTNGHLDVLKGALTIADRVVVGIGVQVSKQPLFSFEERVDLIGEWARANSARMPTGCEVAPSRGWWWMPARTRGLDHDPRPA
jgi:pantetheine-phosphate adenylyltransferase